MGWVACSVGNAAIRFGGRGKEGKPSNGGEAAGGRGRGTKGGCFLWRCQMRELGERGKGGFEGGELEVGDGHGENPSFSIPFPFWIAIACLNFFSLSLRRWTRKGDEEILQGEKPDNASSTIFHLCLI